MMWLLVSRPLFTSVLLTLLIIHVWPLESFGNEETDQQKDGLVGPVKVITRRDGFLVQTIYYDKSGMREKVESMLVRRPSPKPMSEIFKRDEQGRLLESLVYGTEGVLFERITYWYDNNKNNLTAKLAASPKGKVSKVELYQYDSHSNRILELEMNRGTLVKRKQYSYDAQNRLVSEQSFAANGLVHSEAKYHYEPGSKMKEERWYEEDGVLAQITRHKYDEKENEIEEEIVIKDAVVSKTSMAYVFDEKGNWIKRSSISYELKKGHFIEQGPSFVERDISYY